MANTTVYFDTGNRGALAPSTSDQLTQVQQVFTNALGVSTVPDPSSPTGLFQQELADILQKINNAYFQCLNSLNPYSAQGVFLDDICSNLSVYRSSGTQATAVVTFSNKSNTAINLINFTQILNSSNQVFYTQSAITVPATGTIDATVIARDYGSITDVSAGSINSLANPFVGLTVNNSVAGTSGTNPENDIQLLTSFLNQRGRGSSGAIISINSSLSAVNIPDFSFFVYENNTTSPKTNANDPIIPVGYTVNANSVFIITSIATTDVMANKVATAIYNALSAGCGTLFGATPSPVPYSLAFATGQTINIYWEKSTAIYLYLQITLPSNEQADPNRTLIVNAVINSYINNSNLSNNMLYATDFLGYIRASVPSITSITSLKIATSLTSTAPTTFFDSIKVPILNNLVINSSKFTNANVIFVTPSLNVI